MKKNLGIILAIALGLSSLLLTIAFNAGWVQAKLSSQVNRETAPTMVSYQGQIWDGSELFAGTGYFKFAIVNDRGDVLWTNDGVTPEPAVPVALNVVNGLFSVNLGDTSIGTSMDQPLSASVFADPLTFLRVWFNKSETGPYTQLPDQPIASVPYALRAESAQSSMDSDNLGGIAAASYQLRVNGTCPEGSAVRVVSETGTVTCEEIPQVATFTRSTIASRGNFGSYLSIAKGSDGLGLISYLEADNNDLMVAHCNDLNCTSAESFLLDETGDVGYYTSIAIGNDGLGVVAYFDLTNTALKVAKCADVVCSFADVITTVDNYKSAGYESVIAVRSDGNPVIAYREGQEEDLKYIRCTLPDCSTFSPPVTLDYATTTGYAISMTMGADGFPLITYFDTTMLTLYVIRCQDANCASTTKSTVAVFSSTTSPSNDIVLGANGFGLISYYNHSSSGKESLFVAACTNAACSSQEKHILVEGSVFSTCDIKMVLSEDGLGLITFHDFLNDDLKIVHCDNELCTTATAYTLDTPGFIGCSSDIALGSDGLGLIAYSDGDNDDLKVAHCSNEWCIPINYGDQP